MTLAQDTPATTTPQITLPDIPAIAMGAGAVSMLTPDGEVKSLTLQQAASVLHKKAALVCYAPYIGSRLKLDEFHAFDVLELFAFIHPAQFCIPTTHGLAKHLGLAEPQDTEDQAFAILDIARALLQDLAQDPLREKADPAKIAHVMGLQGKGWAWTPYVVAACGEPYDAQIHVHSKTALNIWKHLPEWSEDAPEPPAGHHAVTGEEAAQKLQDLLGHDSEQREQQVQYARNITAAFKPAEDEENPHIVMAEAGTGIGKTLGYIAPASLWAEKNQGSVWISTFTKNLQRQIEQELDRLYPNRELKDAKVAIRKGRENYLCLLNLEEKASGAGLTRHPNHAVAAGIMTRWAAASKDGDLSGSDFPGWLVSLLGYDHTLALADRRGECIYSACDHYQKCFVEKSVRKAKQARLVIANHALVMIQADLASPGEDLPSRYVFDEAHHLFDAADNAFCAHLTGRETRDLRRWILGPEGGKRYSGFESRGRGLRRRIEDLVEGDATMEEHLKDILHAAQCLTGDQWTRRMKNSAPDGPAETFLHEVYKQVMARAHGRDGPYSIETEAFPVNTETRHAAQTLKKSLQELQKPMQQLSIALQKKLSDDQGALAADTRKRMDAVSRSIERRPNHTLLSWIDMLDNLTQEKQNSLTNTNYIEWMEIERIDGRAIDVGLFRHWIDPMLPFAKAVQPHVHGMAVTSATLRDSAANDQQDWQKARARTGAQYLSPAPHEAYFESPFNYQEQTRIYIINDVRKDDLRQVAGAYKALFMAAQGGALGLFTAIQRLRAVHEHIAPDLEQAGLPLYSQHVDDVDPGTLIDMFRDDTHACLLGTDAIRDGVDVPGHSLRLLVFDRVPWPRPTILHKARREAFGKRAYDEMLTRLKLKQAYGRLIRRTGDHGVFVMLNSMFPSRLHDAFPPNVTIEKLGLAQVSENIKAFFENR